MKKLRKYLISLTIRTIILSIVLTMLISCSTDDEGGCKCQGEFYIFGQTGQFYVDNVDCDTGEPYLSQVSDDTFFRGCRD